MTENGFRQLRPLLALGIGTGALAMLLWGLSLLGSPSRSVRAAGPGQEAAPPPAQIPPPGRVVTTVVGNIAIGHGVGPDSVAPGGTLLFTVALDNRSTQTPHMVTLTHTLPSRTTFIDHLLMGPGLVHPQDSTLTYSGILPGNGPASTIPDVAILIQAQVEGDAPDGTVLTATLQGLVDLTQPFALAITATVSSIVGPTPTPLPTPPVFTPRTYLPLLLRNHPPRWHVAAGFPVDRPAYGLIACGETLFAGSEGAIHASQDGGRNWQRIWSGDWNVLALTSPDNCATLYAATWGGGVLRSSDGATWTPMIEGLESNLWLYALAAGTDGRTVYAGTATGGVYKNDGRGGPWSPLGATQPFSDVRSLLVQQLFWSDVVYAGTVSGLYRWQNGRWHGEPGLEDRKVWALAVDDAPLPVRYAGIDKAQAGGVYARSTSDQRWARLEGSPDDTVHALAIASDTIFAGTRDNGVYISQDGGETWEPMNLGLGNKEVRSLAVTGERLIAGTKGGVWWFPLKQHRP